MRQALDQLAPDPRVDRGDEREPEAREARRQHRNRDEQPAQPALPRVLLHQLAVGRDVGSPDLEHSGRARLEVERRDEVGDEVLDGDRLRSRPHPAGRDHGGQPLGERAHELEREAAGSDHDRGPELDCVHTRGREQAAYLLAAREMRGEVGA